MQSLTEDNQMFSQANIKYPSVISRCCCTWLSQACLPSSSILHAPTLEEKVEGWIKPQFDRRTEKESQVFREMSHISSLSTLIWPI